MLLNLLFIIFIKLCSSELLYNWLDPVVNSLIDTKLHHLTIFSNNLSNNYNNNYILQRDSLLKKASHIVPIVSCNQVPIKIFQESEKILKPFLRYTRSTTIYVVLQEQDENGNYNVQLSNFIRLLSIIQPVNVRSRILIIFFTNYDEFSYKQNLMKLLMNAWTLKFLDLSILIVNNKYKHFSILSYNPFKNDYLEQFTKNSSLNFFPDKMKNMEKFPLNLLMIDLASCISPKNESEDLRLLNKLERKYYFIPISEKLNFSINLVERPIKSGIQQFKLLHEGFKNLSNNIYLHIAGFTHISYVVNKNITISNFNLNSGRI